MHTFGQIIAQACFNYAAGWRIIECSRDSTFDFREVSWCVVLSQKCKGGGYLGWTCGMLGFERAWDSARASFWIGADVML